MGLVITRRVGETFWIDDAWFQVANIASKGVTLQDRKGDQIIVSQQGRVQIKDAVFLEEGFRRTVDAARIVITAPRDVPIWRSEAREATDRLGPGDTEAALVASVPYEHLVTGLDTCKAVGKVAFGSRNFEVFRELAAATELRHLPVLIYASWDGAKFPPKVTWTARFEGSIESGTGRHPDGMKFRPSSTEKYPGDNVGHWAVFWEVSELQHVGYSDGIAISDLWGFRSKKKLTRGFRPEGPMIVENPMLST